MSQGTPWNVENNGVVRNMAVEEIKKVTETEQEIKKQLENAAADGKQKVLEAQRAARRQLEENRQEAEGQVRHMMTEAEEEAAKWTQEVLAKAEEECQALKAAAGSRLDRAAALIVEKVVSG